MVPPFVLEDVYDRAAAQQQRGADQLGQNEVSQQDALQQRQGNDAVIPADAESTQEPPDTWVKFITNIGSNAAYNGRHVGVPPEGAPHVDYDWDSEWGGKQRLDALFNYSLGKEYRFNNVQDRKEWNEYIEKVKQAYYGNAPLPSSSSTSSSEASHGSFRGLNKSWIEDLNRERERWRQLKQRKLRKWRPQASQIMIDSQYLPLAFRIMIVALSALSLGMAVRIFMNSSNQIRELGGLSIPQQPSTIMAICVNTIAIVYTIYIGLDEFWGKPLGLRNPLTKLKLILLDLLFIIFSSANLALAFHTRYDRDWVCTQEANSYQLLRDNTDAYLQYPEVPYICRKQKALASFLFVLLFMWVTTFTVSIVRVVDKVNQRQR